MQIAQPVESLQRERQAGQQPDDEQAALVVVADMLQAITILSIVEAFIFNVPSTLGHVIQTAADARRREVGEPVGLDDMAGPTSAYRGQKTANTRLKYNVFVTPSIRS